MKASTANVSTLASDTIVSIIVALIPSTVLAYGYAIWFNYEHGDWAYLVADIIFPPMGVINGYILLFSS